MKRSLKFLLLVTVLFTGTMPGLAASYDSDSASIRDLRWRGNTIRVAISSSMSEQSPSIKRGSDVAQAVERSLQRWAEAAGLRLQIFHTQLQNVSPSGPRGDGISLITIGATAENALVFSKNGNSLPAATRVFFDRNGNITEADIVLNASHQFSTDGTFGTYDLETVLMHEAGHLLGLDHSSTVGSLMWPQIGRNGLFSVSSFFRRELLDADLAAVREMYGAFADEEKCCGSVEVKLAAGSGDPASVVWVEDADSGKLVAASAFAANEKALRITSLREGSYNVFVSEGGDGIRSGSILGTVEVSKGSTAVLEADTDLAASRPSAQIGLNGEAALMSLPVNPGKSFTASLVLQENAGDRPVLYSSSKFISIDDGNIQMTMDPFGRFVAVFDVTISEDASPGAYSLCSVARTGHEVCFPGVFTVSSHQNPWYKRDFSKY